MFSTDIPAVQTSQEEADTRLLLHAKHAADHGASAVVIRSIDTNVLDLSVAMKPFIPCQLYILRGVKKTELKYIDTSRIVHKDGVDLCSALPAFHSFTGCDVVSAFSFKGKDQPFKIIKSNPEFIHVMQSIGKDFTFDDNLIDGFTCTSYGAKKSTVNELRYYL